MATVGFYLRKDQKNRYGKSILHLYVAHKNRRLTISLGIPISPKEWDVRKQRFKTGKPGAKERNKALSDKLEKAYNAVVEAQLIYVNPTIEMLREVAEQAVRGDVDCFIRYSRKVIHTHYEALGKIATAKRLTVILNKLEAFNGGKRLPFEMMSVGYLNRFHTHLMADLGNSVNTATKNMSGIRTLYYRAMREGRVESNPWDKITLTTEPVKREHLTLAELEKVERVPLKEGTKIWHARNIFFLGILMGGIRISDMLTMEWERFTGRRYVFTQKKTDKRISVYVVDPALAIIRLYLERKDTERYVFPFLDGRDMSTPEAIYKTTHYVTTKINQALHNLRKRAGISKSLTTHIARHSFGQLARKKGVPIEMISEIYGHANVKETETYLRGFEEEASEAAMKKIFH